MAADPSRSELVMATTVGIVVIGNEVLSAKVRDQNAGLLIEAFTEAGVRVQELAVVRDDVARIAAVVKDFSARFDVVVTTGGVGPTHDDCTWQAVALALDRPLQLHVGLVQKIEAKLGHPMSEEQRRLARLPVGAELVADDTRWPTMRCANVYVLPGPPSMVAPRAKWLAQRYAAARSWLCTLFLRVDEWDEVPAIDAVVARFADVEIGSYPVYHEADHRLRLTFEGPERARVQAAADWLAERVGEAQVVRRVWTGGPAEAGAMATGGEARQPWQP
jgi:molybdenum cofactor synthesis domain-containing protein